MKKTLCLTIALSVVGLGAFAQDVNIPDANFKAYLVGNSAVNTNSDTEIQVSEAAAFTGNIFGNNLGITDLTGIEAFTSLDGLYVRDNNLGTFDISACAALTFLDCRGASLTALDITSNTALTGVECSINNLTTLDVSNNPAMTFINCGNNDLTSLDVTNNPLLSNFTCDNNDLTSLDVTNCTALSYFVCNFNDFGTIDVSNCTSLSYFACTGTNLNSLDVSNNTTLSTLFCPLNNLTLLDLSANTSLVFLNCIDNDLSILNMANGNNMNVSTFNASTNPNLTCIQVDDAAYSTTNWTNIDATASFSLDCSYPLAVDEVNLDQNLFISPNPVNDNFTINTDLAVEKLTIVSSMGTVIETIFSSNKVVNANHLTPGVYYIQIETDKGSVVKRFVKD